MSTVIKGQNAVHVHHTSGRLVVADTRQKTIVKQGKYADLEAIVPKKGGTFEGLQVVSAELSPAKGGMGLLSVTGLKRSTSASTGDPESDETIYEVEMAQLEKPILCHPSFKVYAEQIELWRAGDPAQRAAYKYTDAAGNEGVALQGMALKAAQLILRGVESYLVFSPVCRRTTRVSAAAVDEWTDVGGACGKRGSPPNECAGMVSGQWQWLKTGDRAVQTAGAGAERAEEWTGADEWDADLYEAAQ